MTRQIDNIYMGRAHRGFKAKMCQCVSSLLTKVPSFALFLDGLLSKKFTASTIVHHIYTGIETCFFYSSWSLPLFASYIHL